MDNLEIYNSLREVPQNAQKPIQAGRLKGMTDINPMWRIKALTEKFGPCGIGWKVEVIEKQIIDGSDGQKVAVVDALLYIKTGGEWSSPIPGTGGAMLISNERNGPYTSDEAFKMAYTDAISVCCKMLGVGADVYWQQDRDKYITNDPPAISTEHTRDHTKASAICSECGVDITSAVNDYSIKNFKRPLCRSCQSKYKR